MSDRFCLHVMVITVLYGCTNIHSGTGNERFQLIPSDETHIRFANTIDESDTLNILAYEYLYNGGGVGVLDVNNDGLSDLFFTGNQVPNALYLNKGNMEFEDISVSAGIQLKNTWCTGVSIVDINMDGFDDIYVCVGGPGNKSVFPNKLFINQGNSTFKESAEEYGLADPAESVQAAFFDYDKDGDLDMYLLVGGGFERSAIIARPIMDKGENRNTDKLYQNIYDSALGHPVFRDVSEEAGILTEGFGLGVSILDADQDSWPDVCISNDYISRDQLYINNGNGTFTDRSLEFFKHTSYFSMGNDVGDINNDGLPDIVTVDMLPEDVRRRKLMSGPNDHDRFYMAVQYNYGYQYMRNMLHLNHGQNGFSEIGQLAGIHRTDWSWAPLLADFDNDGYQDLYITNGFGRDITDLDFVKFRKDIATPFGDRSKLQKLILDSLRQRPSVILPDYIYRNEGNLTFSDQPERWGITHSSISNGAAYADLDRDGDLDIIVNNINEEVFIYKNTTVDTGSLSSGYLKLDLQGPSSNPAGFGSTIRLYANDQFQCRYHQSVRGFQSSVEKTIHIGVGLAKKIDSLIVQWPDGRESRFHGLPVNKTLHVKYEEATVSSEKKIAAKRYFTPVSIIDYVHKENDFSDFKTQPLLLHGFSRQGPAIAVSDVNGDGREDIFIGGAYQSPAALFVQSQRGEFHKRIISDDDFEDLGAVFFDADGDHDVDLYVASGGSERYPGHDGYKDRLYVNDGKGNFTVNESALPSISSSTSCVTAGDYDHDGDFDLFIGGRVRPGEYPQAPESYILENRSGKFVDVTDEACSTIRTIGMVTSAAWTDFNNDMRQDLIVVGEFMRITLLKNDGGKLVNITDQTSLKNSYGLWNSITPGDFDNDGDIDFIAGNLGLNTPFKVTPQAPLEIVYADFDQNGSIDPIFSSHENGKSYPVTSLDQLTQQLPALKKHLLHYRDYARTTTGDLLKLTGDVPYKKLTCEVLASSLVENRGGNEFIVRPLPLMAQIAPVNGVVAEDINLDGKLDVILVGNSYDAEVVHGRYDASVGTVLVNAGNRFNALMPAETSFVVCGDAKAMVRLERADKKSLLLVTQNNDKLVSYVMDGYNTSERLSLKENEISAVLILSDGAIRKMEFPIGSSYLSQGSKSIVLTPAIMSVELFDGRGRLTRAIATGNLKGKPLKL